MFKESGQKLKQVNFSIVENENTLALNNAPIGKSAQFAETVKTSESSEQIAAGNGGSKVANNVETIEKTEIADNSGNVDEVERLNNDTKAIENDDPPIGDDNLDLSRGQLLKVFRPPVDQNEPASRCKC